MYLFEKGISASSFISFLSLDNVTSLPSPVFPTFPIFLSTLILPRKKSSYISIRGGDRRDGTREGNPNPIDMKTAVV